MIRDLQDTGMDEVCDRKDANDWIAMLAREEGFWRLLAWGEASRAPRETWGCIIFYSVVIVMFLHKMGCEQKLVCVLARHRGLEKFGNARLLFRKRRGSSWL